MTRTKKLFLATALVAVGFGVASFLGSPNAAYLSHRAAKNSRAVPNDDHDGTIGVVSGAGPAESAGARLVPEVSAGFENASTASEDFADADGMTPLLLTTNAEAIRTIASIRDDSALKCDVEPRPLLEMSSAGSVEADGISLTAAAPAIEPPSPSPRAKLLAVRPLPDGGHGWRGTADDVTVRSTPVLPPSDVAVASFATPTGPWMQAGPATQLAAKTQAEVEPGREFPSTSVHEPAPETVRAAVMDDDVERRTHIVIDGDSLPKLAGRYLGDPERSDEIFELNRERLENPELLPIGVELKIPNRERTQPGSIADVPREASLAASRGAALGGMVPVRPIPPISTVKPRAQLLQPLPTGWQRERVDR